MFWLGYDGLHFVSGKYFRVMCNSLISYSELFQWACFIFKSRQFPSIALHGDASSLKREYQSLVEIGVNMDDGPQVLLPLLDMGNHEQGHQPTYGFRGAALTMCKGLRLLPGEEIRYPYDKNDQRFNNTTCQSNVRHT